MKELLGFIYSVLMVFLTGFYSFLSLVVIQDKMKKDRNIYIYINTCIYLRVTTSLRKKKLYVLITVLIGIKAILVGLDKSRPDSVMSDKKNPAYGRH